MKPIVFAIVGIILAGPPAFGQPSDLLSGVPIVNDLTNYPATFVARPEPGETVTDPQFGVTIRRITDGEYFIVWWAADMLVLDRQGRVVNVIGDPEYSHLAPGRLATPTITADFYWKHAFDLPYPTRGSLNGSYRPGLLAGASYRGEPERHPGRLRLGLVGGPAAGADIRHRGDVRG